MSIYEDIDKDFQNFISNKTPKREGLLSAMPDTGSEYDAMEKEMADMGFQRSNDNDSWGTVLSKIPLMAAGNVMENTGRFLAYGGKPTWMSEEEYDLYQRLPAEDRNNISMNDWVQAFRSGDPEAPRPLPDATDSLNRRINKGIMEYGENLARENTGNYTPYSAKSIAQGFGGLIPSMVEMAAMKRMPMFKPTPLQEAGAQMMGAKIGNAVSKLPVNAISKRAGKAGEYVADIANNMVLSQVEAAPEAVLEQMDAERGYIEEAKANGTYVPGKTEEEAGQVGRKVYSDNILLNTTTDAMQNALIDFISRGKGSTTKKLIKNAMLNAPIGGFTEGMQGIIPKNAAGQDWNFTDPDIGEAALVGALAAGIPGAANVGLDYRQNRAREKQLVKDVRNMGQGQDGSEPLTDEMLTDNEQQIVNGIRNVNDIDENNPPPPPGTAAAAEEMMQRNGTPSFEFTRGTRWVLNNDSVNVDNLQDVTKAGIGDISTAFMEMTGQPLIITSGTDGAGALHMDGTYSHGTGFKIDVSGNGLEDPELRHAFIEYCESKGIRVLDEYENPSPNSTGGHLDLEFHGYNGAGSVDEYSGPVNPVMRDIETEQPAADTGMIGGDLTGQSFLESDNGPLFADETAKAQRDSELENLSTEELQYMMNDAERAEYETEAAKIAQKAAQNNPYGIPTNLENTMQEQRNVALGILRRRKVGNDIPVNRSKTSYPARNRQQAMQQKNAVTPYSKQAQDNLRTSIAGMNDAALADAYRTAKDIPTRQIIVDELQKRIANANNAARLPGAQEEANTTPMPPKQEVQQPADNGPAMVATRVAKSGQGSAQQETNINNGRYDAQEEKKIINAYADSYQNNTEAWRNEIGNAKQRIDTALANGELSKERADQTKANLNKLYFKVQGELDRRKENRPQQNQSVQQDNKQSGTPSMEDVQARARKAGIKESDLPDMLDTAIRAAMGDQRAKKRFDGWKPEIKQALTDILSGNIERTNRNESVQNDQGQVKSAQKQEERSNANENSKELQKPEARENRNQNQNSEPGQNQQRKDADSKTAEKQSENVKQEEAKNFETGEYDTGKNVKYTAELKDDTKENNAIKYRNEHAGLHAKLRELAKKHGTISREADMIAANSFSFADKESRDAFMKEADKLVDDYKRLISYIAKNKRTKADEIFKALNINKDKAQPIVDLVNDLAYSEPANETREEKAERLIYEAFTDEDELDMAMSCFFDNMENPLQALNEKRKALQDQFNNLVQNAYNALAKTLPKDDKGNPTGAGVNLIRKSDDSGYIRESQNPLWYRNDYKNGVAKPYTKTNMMQTAEEMVLGERKDMDDNENLAEYNAANPQLRPMFEENRQMRDNIETLDAIEPKMKEIQKELDNSKQETPTKKAVSVEENIANGKKALEHVIETHEDVENAMYREDVGNIDLVWGTPGNGPRYKGGFGISHIIEKRNSEDGKGKETAEKLIEVIAKGENTEQQNSQNGDGEPRLKIHYDGYTAILSLSKDKNSWLLTGWQDDNAGKEKTTVSAGGEGYDSTAATTATPTLTRRNGVPVASANTIPQNQQESKGETYTSAKQHLDAFKDEIKAEVKSITFTQAKADELVKKYNNSLNEMLERKAITKTEAEANQHSMEDVVKRGLILNDGRKLLEPKVREWLDNHPFAYDKTKSREENIAAAQKLKEDFIRETGISSTANQELTPEREELQKRILDYLYNVGAENRKHERKATLAIGYPAAGKSTVTKDLTDNKGYLLVDADEAKKLLPEFHNGVLADIVHDESSDISKALFRYAIEQGDNICYPTIGGKYKSLKKKINLLHNDVTENEKTIDAKGNPVPGYEVTLSYVDVSADKALERIFNRFEETGRFDNPQNIHDLVLQKPEGNVTIQLPDGKRKDRLGSTETVAIDNQIVKNYLTIKNEKGVEKYEWFDNGLPVGASYEEMLRESGELSSGYDGRRESGVGESGSTVSGRDSGREESSTSAGIVKPANKAKQNSNNDSTQNEGAISLPENEAEPEAESILQPEEVPETLREKSSAPQAKIEDFGQKIGGARKDMYISLTPGEKTARPKSEKKADDGLKDRPWLRGYDIKQGEDGKWTIIHKESEEARKRATSVSSWIIGIYGNPAKKRPVETKTYDTKEEAEHYAAIDAVSEKHRVTMRGSGENATYEIIRRIGGKQDYHWFTIKSGFKTDKEAMTYMALHPEEILKVRTSFGEADLPKPEIKGWNDARKGKAPKRLKADQNATADMFTNTFGFRGVQFGNWENQIERQSVMNAAYEGLLDLAEIMGVNPKIISLNGELGLAFGARGQGLSGAVAHYEPGYTVINLTKMKGAGSLAHEWMHALDHYLMIKGGVISNERDSKGKLTASNFNTHASDSDYQLQRCRLNGALKLAFRNLKNTAFYKDVVETKDETDALKWEGEARRRLDEELNAMRQHLANDRKYGSKKKAATEEQLKRFDELATKLAAADETYEWDWNYQTHTFPTMRKMSELYKEITGRALLKKDPSDTYKRLNYAVRNLQVRKETLADAQAKKEFTKQVPTEYSRNNTTIDRGRSTEYWTKPTEMLARAFSSFVEDSAKAKGYSTDFLSYGSDNRLILFGKPFPEGKEREALNQAFREFFKEVQKEVAKNQEKTGEIRFSIRAAAKEQPADNTRYQAAYHGSPHVFDTFSLDHVGSGEGHQVHGYGLYFSEDKAVADNYRYMLTVDKEGSVNVGKDTYKPKDVWNNEWFVNGKWEVLDDVQNEALQLIASDNGDVNKTIAFINDVLKKQPGVKNDKEAQQFYRDLLKYIKKHKDEFSIPPGSQGQLYEVDIPDKNLLLDEQATLKNQDSDVQKKTVKAISALSDSQKDAFFRKVLKDELEISSDALTKAQEELVSVERVTLNLQRLGMWRYIPSAQAKDDIKRNLKENGYTDEQIRQFIKNRKLIDGEVERYAKEHNRDALQEKYNAELEAENKRKDKIVSEAIRNAAKVLQDKNGRFIYDTLTEVMEGNPRKASEFLNKHGIKGITYWGERDGRCFVVFDDKAIQIMQRYDAAVRAHGEEIKRSVDAIVKEVKDAYPSAKDVKVEGNNISFTMPNGVKLTVNIKDQIIISGKDEAKARQDHGLTDTDTGIVVEGYTRKLDNETLVVLSQESSEGTAYHEAMHTVRDYCLTEKENRDLEKYYGKKAKEHGIDVDEAIADGYRDWKLARAKGGGTLFGKLYKKMMDFIDTVKAIFNGMYDVHRIYEKIENGDIWNRDAQGRFAAKEGEAKYSAQEYSSADTSLNQTPSIFKRVQWEKGTTNIDIGGGRFDTATDYMKEQGVNNIVFDPFNRDAEHNRNAFEKIKEKGDTVTVANVLNVIKEDGIRDNVILQAAKALKPDGTAYFGIYEGSGTGEGKATTKGWQNNRKTADYVTEIAKHFNDVSRKGNMIVAKEPIVIPGEKATWSMDASGENDVRYSIREKATAAAEKLANPEEVKYGSDDTGFGRVTQHIGGRQQKNLIQKGLDAWRNLYKHIVDEDTHAHKVDEAIEDRTGQKLDDNDSFYNNVRMAGNIAKGHAEWLIAGDEKHGETVRSRIKNETLKKQFNAKATLQNVIDTVADKVMNAKYGDFLEKHKMRDWTQVLETHLAAWRLKEMYNLHLENWRAEHEAWRKRKEDALARGEKFREKEPVYKPYKLPGNLTIQDINAAIKAAPPEVEQAAQLFYAFNKNNMILLADAGLISGENYQALINKYKRYCPLMRDFSDTAAADEFITSLSKGGDSVANVSNPLRRISEEGSNRNLLSPLASAIKATAVYCDRAERNKVGQLAVELAEKHKLDDLIWRVPGNAADAKNCIFTVMKDGKKQAYQCLQELYEPIVGYNEDAANMVLSAMSIPARMLRIGATISPTFALRNMIRDTFFAGIASKNGFIPVWDTIRGGIALRNDPEMRAKMEAMGVGMYTFYGNEMNAGKKLGDLQFKGPETLFDYVKGIIKNPLTGTYKALEDFSAFSEQATRMGEFQRAIKNGKSLDEAARDARNLTIDFSRHGSLGKHVNRIIPFFNACVQGTDMMARLLLKDFPGTMMKLTKYIILPSIALWAINHDKDWWKEMDPDMKNSGWFFETPAGIVRLPKPQEAGVLFGSGVEALLDQALKRDPEAMKNWAIAFIDAIKPNVVPTVFLPLLENTANFSYFRMKPIVNRANEKLPGEQQYSNGTSELSKMLGGSAAAHAYNKGGYSPAKIDNFIRGYTGTMGMLLWQAAGEGVRKARGQESNSPAKDWQEMPFAREFFANDYNLNRSLNDFYEMASAAQAQHNGYGRKGHPTAAVQAVTKARNVIADERKAIQKITDSKSLTPERKQELIKKRRDKINRIAKVTLERYRDKF